LASDDALLSLWLDLGQAFQLVAGQPRYYRSEALHLPIKQQDRGEAIAFSLLPKMFDGLIDAHRSC
jgi:hypothetical protein